VNRRAPPVPTLNCLLRPRCSTVINNVIDVFF
jgi:hypothetical protein